jgi:hypothetical protein
MSMKWSKLDAIVTTIVVVLLLVVGYVGCRALKENPQLWL